MSSRLTRVQVCEGSRWRSRCGKGFPSPKMLGSPIHSPGVEGNNNTSEIPLEVPDPSTGVGRGPVRWWRALLHPPSLHLFQARRDQRPWCRTCPGFLGRRFAGKAGLAPAWLVFRRGPLWVVVFILVTVLVIQLVDPSLVPVPALFWSPSLAPPAFGFIASSSPRGSTPAPVHRSGVWSVLLGLTTAVLIASSTSVHCLG